MEIKRDTESFRRKHKMGRKSERFSLEFSLALDCRQSHLHSNLMSN